MPPDPDSTTPFRPRQTARRVMTRGQQPAPKKHDTAVYHKMLLLQKQLGAVQRIIDNVRVVRFTHLSVPPLVHFKSFARSAS